MQEGIFRGDDCREGETLRLPTVGVPRESVFSAPSLVAALRSGKVAGAGLDVFADEPPPADSPLFQMGGVILTPHMACYSEISMDEMHETAIKHVVDVLGKERR